MLRLREQKEDARRHLRVRTLGSRGTGRTIRTREADLKGSHLRGVDIGQPRLALPAQWTNSDLALPVEREVRLCKALPSPCLPTGVIRDRANDPHAMLGLTRQQIVGIGVATVDQMLGGQQPF